ncbi:MAG: DUF2029 domain-containing protein [Microscillaceae bacterium]|nr:DUF2029 domain-containing protein [Microscillaceae bacterium]
MNSIGVKFLRQKASFYLFILSGGLLLFNLAFSIRYMHGPMIDFRNRITGIRAWQAGYDPYFYKWKPSDPLSLLHPRELPNRIVNRTTATPSLLSLHAPLAGLYYPWARYAWWAGQFACLALIGGLFYLRAPPENKPGIIFLALGVFPAVPGWQMHLAVGQIYILYAAVLAAMFYFAHHPKASWQAGGTGILLGILIWLRPPWALLLLVLWAYRFFPVLKTTLMTLVCLAFISWAAGAVPAWKSYFAAMDEFSREQIGEMSYSDDPREDYGVEGLIEGTDFNDFSWLEWLKVDNASVQYAALRLFQWKMNKYQLGVGLLLASLLWLAWGRARAKASLAELLLLGFLWVIMAECFLPAPRHPYNFVQWFPILLAYWQNVEARKWQSFSFQLMLLGLLCSLGLMRWLPDGYTIGEFLLWLGLALYLIEERLLPNPASTSSQ